MRGNVDVEYFPNTAIVGVLVQGDVTHGLVGVGNQVKNIKVYISESAYDYPNNIIGIAVIDVKSTTVENISVTLNPVLRSRLMGKQISIFLSGEYSDSKIKNSSLAGFDCGIFLNNGQSDCLINPSFYIENINFSKELSLKKLMICSDDVISCDIKYKNLSFTA